MQIQVDEVSIRCMGCSTILALEEAARAEWKLCRRCQCAICNFCFDNLDEHKHCLSYFCTQKHQIIDPIPLPIEKILIFAQENYQEEYKKGLIYKLFFEEQEHLHKPSFFVLNEKKIELIDESQRPTKIQEEMWKNSQLVVTKRRGGKFITWEKMI